MGGIKEMTRKFIQGVDLQKVKDESLIQMTGKSKDEAFKLLYHRHTDELFRFLYRIVLEEEACKEVLQETWLKVYRNSDKFNGKASFKTWLYTIGKNTAFDWLKKKKDLLFDEPSSIDELSNDDEDILERMVRQATREQIRRALENLTVDQKTVLAMWMEDISTNEMAQVMGRSPQAIKNLIHRSKKNLKTLLIGSEHE
jgi:RNA polymerase sigma-70 factor (ECF subfamily)